MSEPTDSKYDDMDYTETGINRIADALERVALALGGISTSIDEAENYPHPADLGSEMERSFTPIATALEEGLGNIAKMYDLHHRYKDT